MHCKFGISSLSPIPGSPPIKPLTFLVGLNSSGKTSIIQSLLLLRQTVKSRDLKNPLW